MIERGDNSGVYQYGRAEHFTHIISDKPSPKDKYVAYAINIPDYELAADVYNINVTSPSGQQETFKILINLEHLRQTLERKSLTAVQKSQCEIITPKKPGEAILHAFNATYQQIRENMSEFARCHYGYIQIPPVTTFRADDQKLPKKKRVTGFMLINPKIFVPSIIQWEICRILLHWLKMLKNLVSISFLIIPLTLWELGVVVKMTWIIPLLIYERRSVKI